MNDNELSVIEILNEVVKETKGLLVNTKRPFVRGDEIRLGIYSVKVSEIPALKRELLHICESEGKTLIVYTRNGVPRVTFKNNKVIYNALLVNK